MKTLIYFIFSICCVAQASNQGEHREHGAHAHGSGQLAIAFDDLKGKIEFRAAAEAVLGFEHSPRTEKEKKVLAGTVRNFENSMAQMIQFDPALKCRLSKESVGLIPEKGSKGSGEHSNWEAHYSVACEKSPLGSRLVIDFKNYKNLQDVDVTVLVGALQKSAEYKKQPLTIELK